MSLTGHTQVTHFQVIHRSHTGHSQVTIFSGHKQVTHRSLFFQVTHRSLTDSFSGHAQVTQISGHSQVTHRSLIFRVAAPSSYSSLLVPARGDEVEIGFRPQLPCKCTFFFATLKSLSSHSRVKSHSRVTLKARPHLPCDWEVPAWTCSPHF